MSSAEQRRPGEARGTRNGRKNPLAGRDTPLFTQMRRNNRGRQQFLTESTNTSYIPSPSPVRSAPFAKPRQAHNDGAKTLNGAYKAVSEEKENELRQSTPALPEQRTQSRHSIKRSPIHISAEGSPQPSARDTSRSITRTPSPSRERDERPSLVSPASFASESSEPPYALPEIYRRIEDEEDIAGASDVSDSTKGSIGEQRNKRLSLSPAGLRSSSVRRLSPRLLAQEVKAKASDAAVQDQPHLSSGASSPFEETVYTEPEMLARDERRVREAIASDTVAFANARKGRPGLTLENLRRQEVCLDPKIEDESQSSSNGKVSSPGINIPSGWGAKARKDKRWLENITQGRQLANAEAATAHVHGNNSSGTFGKASNSVRNWLKDAAASPVVEVNEPIEDSQPQPLRERPSFEKARLWENQRQKDSLAPPKPASPLSALRERSIERLEKSAVATNRLGALGDRRTLQKLARKTSGQQIDTLSNPVSASSVPAEQPTATQPTHSAANSDSGGAASHSIGGASASVTSAAQIKSPEGPVAPEVAKQLAFAAASQPKDSPDSRDLLRRFTRASSSSPAGAARASHAGSSKSDGSDKKQPSPLSLEVGSITRATDPVSTLADSTKPLVLASEETPDRKPEATSTAKDVMTSHPTSVSESKLAQPDLHSQMSKSDARRGKARDLQGNEEKPAQDESKPALVERIVELVAETPQVPTKASYMQTPKVVVGGWVDTPIAKAKQLGMIPEDMSDPEADYDQDSLLEAAKIVLGTDKAARVGPRLQKKSRRDLENLAQTAPDLPHSALAAIIDHAKRKNRGEEGSEGEETLQLDEATIKSLEQLLVKDEKESENSQQTFKNEKPQKEATDKHHPQNHLAQQKSSKELKSGPRGETTQQHKDSSDTRKGVSGGTDAKSDARPNDRKSSTGSRPPLSVIIEDSPKSKITKPKKSVAVVAPGEACDQAGEFHDFIWPCDACRKRAQASGNGHSDDDSIGVVQWQALQVPRLWYWPSRRNRIPRPTRLGWLLMIGLLCYWAEAFVASFYTPPFYAWKMEGFGVDYNMVRPPFVIPKLIWRGPAGQAVRWVWWVLSSVVTWIADVFGVDMSVFSSAAPPKTSHVKYVFRQAYEPLSSYEQDIGIGRDHIVR